MSRLVRVSGQAVCLVDSVQKQAGILADATEHGCTRVVLNPTPKTVKALETLRDFLYTLASKTTRAVG